MKKVTLIFSLLVILGIVFWRQWPRLTVNVPSASLKQPEEQAKIAPPAPKEIYFVGDIMLDRGVEALMLKNGFDYPYQNIPNIFSGAYMVVGNLEGPIVKNPPYQGARGMSFAFDPRNLDSLKKIGFTHFSLANNHTFNMGKSGFRQTRAYLSDEAMVPVGSERECGSMYATTTQEFSLLAVSQVFTDCQDKDIISAIKDLKSQYPEKFLIILIHWGEEYKTLSNKTQQTTAHLLIDNGADLIIGGHPHVIQEVEKYQGKMIFYSLGNFVFDQYFSQETQGGIIVKMRFLPAAQKFEIWPFSSQRSQIFLMEEKARQDFFQKYLPQCKNLLPEDLEGGIMNR